MSAALHLKSIVINDGWKLRPDGNRLEILHNEVLVTEIVNSDPEAQSATVPNYGSMNVVSLSLPDWKIVSKENKIVFCNDLFNSSDLMSIQDDVESLEESQSSNMLGSGNINCREFRLGEWVLRRSGNSFEILHGNVSIATLSNEHEDIEIQGTSIVKIDTLTDMTVTYSELEGGFWSLASSNNEIFIPYKGISKDFQIKNQKVKVKYSTYKDTVSIYGGTLISIEEIEKA